MRFIVLSNVLSNDLIFWSSLLMKSISCLLLSLLSVFMSVSLWAFGVPQLKWQKGGCYNSWCETGWYSSPAITDINNDGKNEVIASLYSVFALNGSNGQLIWRAKSGHDVSESNVKSVGRTWPAVIIKDIDGDKIEEIITAHGHGYVSAYDKNGRFKPGWPINPTTKEFRGLMVDDLDNDNKAEIIVSAAIAAKKNTWVFHSNGQLASGWPQLSGSVGSAWGVFNNNGTTADLTGDNKKEVIVPSDTGRVQVYQADGSLVATHSQYGGRTWAEISAWEDPEIELRGWGTCNSSDARKERYRTNFAYGTAEVNDVDGNGKAEVIVSGNMYDCSVGNTDNGNRYNTVFIFNADRSRFKLWEKPPIDTGRAISEDYNVIESNQPNIVVVDLDGDGKKEILFSAYDGRMHAFWLDKTEHFQWPYSIYNASEGIFRFASEPAIADLDNDGKAEIIFTSWTAKNSQKTGHLYILNYQGQVVSKVLLPLGFNSPSWNGGLAAPTLGNIDTDKDLELVISTAHSGIIAYDLPNTANAKILWSGGQRQQSQPASFDLLLFMPAILQAIKNK